MQNSQILPLSPYQRMRMVEAALDPETSDRYNAVHTYSWAARFTPSFSPRKVQRAFKNLTTRHESLRLRIVEHRGDWAAEILADHPAGLMIEDHGPMSHDDQLRLVAERCAVPMTALDPVLFEMRLLRFGPDGDIILFRAHHAVFDGYSITIMMEEAVAAFLNIPVTGDTVTHKEFVERRLRLSEQRPQEKESYWEGALLPAADPLNVGRQKKGLPPLTRRNLGPARPLENVLSAEASARVRDFAQKTGATPFAQIQAAFGDCLCAMGGASEAMWMTIMGRQDAKLARFVGAEMQAVRMKYAIGSGAQAVADTLRHGADMLPARCFNADLPLGQLYFQFFVNMPKSRGRLKNSPLSKAVNFAEETGFSLGPITITPVPTPFLTQPEFELQLHVEPSPDAPNAAFLAEASSWDMAELESLAKAMNDVIMS
ncbi:MAG: condensation domain-containing protein [Pseudomonadota bacterium]